MKNKYKILILIALIGFIFSGLSIFRLYSLAAQSPRSAWVEFKTDKGYGEMLITLLI